MEGLSYEERAEYRVRRWLYERREKRRMGLLPGRVTKERVEELEFVVAWAAEQILESQWLASAVYNLRSDLARVEESLKNLSREVGRLKERLVGKDAETREKVRSLSEKVKELEREVTRLGGRIIALEDEVAEHLISRGTTDSPVVARYLERFAKDLEEELYAAIVEYVKGDTARVEVIEARMMISGLADPKAPLGAPLRRVTPREVALATVILLAQRLEDQGLAHLLKKKPKNNLVKRLVTKGLLKQLPDGYLAPTSLLKAIYAATTKPQRGKPGNKRKEEEAAG